MFHEGIRNVTCAKWPWDLESESCLQPRSKKTDLLRRIAAIVFETTQFRCDFGNDGNIDTHEKLLCWHQYPWLRSHAWSAETSLHHPERDGTASHLYSFLHFRSRSLGHGQWGAHRHDVVPRFDEQREPKGRLTQECKPHSCRLCEFLPLWLLFSHSEQVSGCQWIDGYKLINRCELFSFPLQTGLMEVNPTHCRYEDTPVHPILDFFQSSAQQFRFHFAARFLFMQLVGENSSDFGDGACRVIWSGVRVGASVWGGELHPPQDDSCPANSRSGLMNSCGWTGRATLDGILRFSKAERLRLMVGGGQLKFIWFSLFSNSRQRFCRSRFR